MTQTTSCPAPAKLLAYLLDMSRHSLRGSLRLIPQNGLVGVFI